MSDSLAALRLQLEWGVDEAIGDVALDRFLPPPAPVATLRRPGPAPVTAAPASAPSAQSLEALFAEIEAFEGCALRTTAMRTVRPDGNPAARLVVVGDAPGSDDDRSGRAFSGPAGLVLDRVLGSIGLDRRSMLLTTLVPWRPPGNRRLSESELQACLPFLHRLLGLVRPDRLVLLGTTAVRALSGQNVPLRKLRGRWIDVQVVHEQLTVPALILPAVEQWLGNATAKQQLWSDLIILHEAVTTP